jgi:hypothetical protein
MVVWKGSFRRPRIGLFSVGQFSCKAGSRGIPSEASGTAVTHQFEYLLRRRLDLEHVSIMGSHKNLCLRGHY